MSNYKVDPDPFIDDPRPCWLCLAYADKPVNDAAKGNMRQDKLSEHFRVIPTKAKKNEPRAWRVAKKLRDHDELTTYFSSRDKEECEKMRLLFLAQEAEGIVVQPIKSTRGKLTEKEGN